MFDRLQIYDRRERLLVGAADLALAGIAPIVRTRSRRAGRPPARILLLRLERIGDLLMTHEAIEDVRAAVPGAQIDLVVGSWNAELARRYRAVTSVETLDARWLAREGTGLGLPAMMRRARTWRRRQYDLALNFQPDIRGNLILAASGAARTAGFSSGGGGAMLDVALDYRPREHTTANARRLVAAVLDVPPRAAPARLELTDEERRAARARLGVERPLVGVHASGGRAIKQWDLDRFAELASRLALDGARIVLTGSEADRRIVDPIARGLPPDRVINLAGTLDIPALAAALEQLDVLVTGDTGPMHLAAAVGTPVVAVFGPSDPLRYAPSDPVHQVLRIDLPCSPCNRIRLPPERCQGHTPDCLTGIDVEMVYRAVRRTLGNERQARETAAAHGR
jgi:lipopolysaccharide heptosyltransferase II